MTSNPNTARVVVPVEPTDAMLQGGCAKHTPGQPMSPDSPFHDRECPSFERRRRIWADMIASAPASPAVGLEEAVGLLREMLDGCVGPLVGGGDGGTHVLTSPPPATLTKARAFLTRMESRDV